MTDFMDAAASRFANSEQFEEPQEVTAARVRAADIMVTMATPGWRQIMAEAEAAVREQEEAALNCEEDDKVLRLQHEARAAREFLKKWKRRIEAAASVEQPSGFQPVAY